MKITQKIYFIYDGKQNSILQLILERNLSDFILLFKFYKIRNYNDTIINIVKKKIRENPFDENIMDKVDCVVEHDSTLSMFQISAYEEYLNQIIATMTDKKQIFKLSISKTYNIFIDYSSLILLYKDIKAISDNFIILDSIYKMTIYKDKRDVQQNIKQEEQIDNTNISNDPLVPNNIFDSVIIPLTNKSIRPTMFYLILTYFNNINYKIENNQQLVITIDEVIPKCITYRNSYMLSLLTSLDMTKDEIKFNCTKMIQLLYSNQYDIHTNKEVLATIIYIILLYFLKFIYITNPDQFLTKYTTWLNCTKTQTKLINYYLQSFIPELKDKFSINFTEFIPSEINTESIINESKKEQHLVSIDQEKFIELIFNSNTLTKMPMYFKFNSKKIINIKNFTNSTNSMLKYVIINNKITTELYELFLKYLKDENLLLYNTDSKFSSYLKMFNILKSIINTENFNQNNINTLSYYMKLIDLIPSSNKIDHNVFVTIVFQILIPYYNDLYKVCEFEDQLLI